MTTKPLRLLAASAVAGALTLTACGDDADAISKDDFLEQANAICEATNDEVNPIFDAIWTDHGHLDEDDPEDQHAIFTLWAEAMAEIEPIWVQNISDIRALGAPRGDEALVAGMLDDFESAIAFYVDTTAAAAEGDEAARMAMDSDSDDPFDEANQRARAYGLTTCADES